MVVASIFVALVDTAVSIDVSVASASAFAVATHVAGVVPTASGTAFDFVASDAVVAIALACARKLGRDALHSHLLHTPVHPQKPGVEELDQGMFCFQPHEDFPPSPRPCPHPE